MRRKVITAILFIFIFSLTGTHVWSSDPPAKDEKLLFIQEFLKVLGSKDRGKIEGLVRNTEPHIMFDAIIYLSNQGISTVAQGNDGRIPFNIAQLIATVYAKEFKKEGLLELVKRYRLYTQEMCKENLRGDSIFQEGNSFIEKEQWKEALDKFLEVLKIYKTLENVAAEANMLHNIGGLHRKLGQHREGLSYYMKALEIKSRIGDVVMELYLLNVIGDINRGFGQYQEAISYYEPSLEISRRFKYRVKEVESLGNIGNIYQEVGKYQEALNCYEQCLEISRRIGYVAAEAKSLGNIGLIYNRIGEYEKTLQYYQQSLDIFRKMGDVSGEADSLNNLGIFYNFLGRYQEALDYHMQALDIKHRIGDVAGQAKSLAGIGNIYHSIGQFENALQYNQQSLERTRKIGDVSGEALSLNNIGNIYKGFGQYQEALNYYRQALAVKQRIGDVSGEAYTLNNIGNLYESLGQHEKALQPLEDSLKLFDQLGVLEGVWRSHVGLGRCLWGLAKGEEAVGHYNKAVEVIEQLYHSTKGLKEEERSSMIGEKGFVYKEFIRLLLELHRKHSTKGYDREAFMVSEKAKSRNFQEMMAKAGARTVLAGDETFKRLIEKEQQLIGEIIHFRTLLTKEISNPEKERNQDVINSLKSQVSNSERSLANLEKEIESKYPRYADLKRPKPLTVEELQETLKPDETVISYAVGKDKLAAFVIGKKSFKLIEINTSKEELSKLTRRFRRGLEDVTEVKDLEKFKPEVAYELYQKIFYPLSSELAGVTKVYISADDILYTLPFEALVDIEINEKAFNEAREKGGVYLSEYNTPHYLIDTYTITYLPSASLLRSLRKYEKPGYGKWSKPLIAFADPIFGPEGEKTGETKAVKGKGLNPETQLTAQILTRSTGNEKLERLKESGQEAEAISRELKGRKEDIYLRNKATEENVYKTSLKDSQYLLFSTHGLLGGDFSGVAEPALALTLIENPPGRDGFLTMSEILGLDLNSELIILSACNTSGKGDKAGSGEGFVGLTRSFMYAGGKSLLVTHWSVESESARDLMVETLKNMQKRGRPESLREAKLNMKKSISQRGNEKFSLSHPFFWAPFVLVGEGK